MPETARRLSSATGAQLSAGKLTDHFETGALVRRK